MRPKLSVITVCYNAANEIRKTVESVLDQTFADYEYIFVDGASKDDTLGEIERYRGSFESKGINVYVKSEPDKGIYDAMNKGVAQSRGQWILMLNAGDCLADAHVFDSVFSRPAIDGKIIYGDTILKEYAKGTAYYMYKPAYPLTSICHQMPFCHQSVFVPRDLMCKYGFDTELRIAADYKFFSQAYTAGNSFLHIPRAISVFDCSGVSSVNKERLQQEYAAIHKVYYSNIEPLQQMSASGISARVKGWIKCLFPGLVYSKARGWYMSKEDAMKENTLYQ